MPVLERILQRHTQIHPTLGLSEHMYWKGFSKCTRKSHMLGCSEPCLYGNGFSKSANKSHMLSNGARKSHMLGCSEHACIGKDSLTAQAIPHAGLQWTCLYWKGFSKGARKSNILGCSDHVCIEKNSQRENINPTCWVAVIMSALKRILKGSTQIPHTGL